MAAISNNVTLKYFSQKLQLRCSNLAFAQCLDILYQELLEGLNVPDRVVLFQLQSLSTNELIAYLKECHQDYVKIELPAISQNFQLVIDSVDSDHMLNKLTPILFELFKKEMIEHFEYEEKFLFPYAESFLNSKSISNQNYSSAQFTHEHPAHTMDISKLHDTVLQFGDELKSNFAFRILAQKLANLRNDLRLHEIIEELVLLPKIALMERDNISARQ